MKYREFARLKWLGCHVDDISQQHTKDKPKYVAQVWSMNNGTILCWPVGWRTERSLKGSKWIHYSNLKVTWPTK